MGFVFEERLERTKVTEPFGYIIKPFEDKELHPPIEMALQRHKRENALLVQLGEEPRYKIAAEGDKKNYKL